MSELPHGLPRIPVSSSPPPPAPLRCTYHNEEGTPVINPQKFPSMLDMTNFGHGLNLTVGWYGNNVRVWEDERREREREFALSITLLAPSLPAVRLQRPLQHG